MGAYRKRCGSSSEASNSSNDPVPMGLSASASSPDFFEWQASQKRCPHQGTGGRDTQTERSAGVPDLGTNAVKKKLVSDKS